MKKIKRLIALMGVFVFISSSILTVGATDSNKTQDIKKIEAVREENQRIKEILGKIGVGYADNESMIAPYAAGYDGERIYTGSLENNIGSIDIVNYHEDGSWDIVESWSEGKLGDTNANEPLYCADPNVVFTKGYKTGIDAEKLYTRETIQTIAAMFYYLDNHMCGQIGENYKYLFKQCAVWWVLNGAHGWYTDNIALETGNGEACGCGEEIADHLGAYRFSGLSWAQNNYSSFQNAKGTIYQGDGQPVSKWTGDYTPEGFCKILKRSANPEITNGNSCYSLKGATYGIYRNSNCSDASWVATMTTNENGDSNTVTLDAGTYYVREGDAPKGYALDRTVHTVQIKAGETYTLKVSDKPTMDPVGVLLGKVDKETNMNKPEGSLPMEGALFDVKFYAGVQSDSDPAADGKTATRTWVFRTNENGFTNYHPDFLESGDELYILPSGVPGIPMGTLTIQETKAPEGYLINPQVFTVKITSNNNGSEFVYTYNEPKVLEQSLDLNIVKKEKNKDYTIEGAVFEHTLPDGTTETVTTDANGTCKFKALGYGQHKIREVSVPDEYTVNEGIVTFTVAKDNKITLDSNTAADNSMQFVVQPDGTASLSVEDTLAPYTLKVTKVNEKGKTLEGAEFTIYTDKDCRTELAKIVTDSNGVATTESLTVEKKYYLKETKAPQGYRIPKDAKGNDYVYEVYTKINDKRQYEYYVNGELHTTSTGDYAIEGTVHERIVNLKVVNQTGLQMPETGTHTTLILVAIGVACMITALKKGKVADKENEKNKKL